MYPVVFFDALRVKIHDEAVVQTKAVYLALAVLPDGTRDILGVWIEQSEGAKFWMKVFANLQARGCRVMLIAVTDGLKGMPDARAAVYSATTTNALENVNRPLRKTLKTRGQFSTHDAATTLIWLALRNIMAT